MGRIDIDANYHSHLRTIGLVQNFRRMLHGIPSIIAFDGKSYTGYYQEMSYDALLQFATDQIPNQIDKMRPGSGTKWLKSMTGRPRILLVSPHSTISILYKHVAFELHQWIDFGFIRREGVAKGVIACYLLQGSILL